MARAVSLRDPAHTVRGPHHDRIERSIELWTLFGRALMQQYPDHHPGEITRVEYPHAGFQVTEAHAHWNRWAATVVPLCDTIELSDDSFDGGVAYVGLSQLLEGPPVITLLRARIGDDTLECLRLSGLRDEEITSLRGMLRAQPIPFDPAGQSP